MKAVFAYFAPDLPNVHFKPKTMRISLTKTTVVSLLFFAFASVQAQNVQLHYDFGKERQFLTSTVEMFKTDQWGSTFFFVDMDYDVDDVEGISLAYWEIARDLKFWDAPLTFHVEFNGGFGQFSLPDGNKQAYDINNMWLAGAAYSFNSKDFSKGITFQALYKYIRNKHNLAYQLTAIWHAHFLSGRLSFLGFADFWKEENQMLNTTHIFLTEPQLWYNFNDHFSLGSEVELGYNFGNLKGLAIMPTLGAKWSF